MNEIFKEVGNIHDEYSNMITTGKLTKKVICDLVVPFRDKYKLTDRQALSIVRRELSITEIGKLLEKEGDIS